MTAPQLGPEDWVAAIEHGLADVDALVNTLLLLHTGRGARQQLLRTVAADMLTPVVTQALTERPQLIHALVKIVDLAMPLYYAQGDAANAKARAKLKQDIPGMIVQLHRLWGEADDRVREPARALLKRLEELQRDPTQWIDAWVVRTPTRGSGRPSLAFKAQARQLLTEARTPDPDAQLDLLRALNIEPPGRGPAKKKPQA